MNKDDLPLYMFEPRYRIWIMALNGVLDVWLLWDGLFSRSTACPTCWLFICHSMYVVTFVMFTMHFAALRAWYFIVVGTFGLIAAVAVDIRDEQDVRAIAMAIVVISFWPAVHHFHARRAIKASTID